MFCVIQSFRNFLCCTDELVDNDDDDDEDEDVDELDDLDELEDVELEDYE